MTNVEVDTLGTGVLAPPSGTPPQYANVTLTWSEDRFLIGWAPWIGYGKQCEIESHLILYAGGHQIFLRGPHKESGNQIYDYTGSDFFPAGYGRFVPKGTVITLQFLVSNTAFPGVPIGGQSNARIFSV